MSQRPPKSDTANPEYAVRRETISGFFSPPLPSSTFHDLVNKGKIVPVKGLRGFYRLNDSLKRLGLREVPEPPTRCSSRSLEDITRLGFALIDAEVFPAPTWMLDSDDLDLRDLDHGRMIADLHREWIEALPTLQEKLAYVAGVLDAQRVVESEMRGDQSNR
ncbi:MAG: hypothetical protein EOP06_13780 [Proteobacteria bacterium]|nr:MAG: hypothetical protein EOP06_13780 [Pseudomonadota bacterium]